MAGDCMESDRICIMELTSITLCVLCILKLFHFIDFIERVIDILVYALFISSYSTSFMVS